MCAIGQRIACCDVVTRTATVTVTDATRRTRNTRAILQSVSRVTGHNCTSINTIMVNHTANLCCVCYFIALTIAFINTGRTRSRIWVFAICFVITTELLAICTEMICRTIHTGITNLRVCFITRRNIAFRTIRIIRIAIVTNILITRTMCNIARNIIQIAFTDIRRVNFTGFTIVWTFFTFQLFICTIISIFNRCTVTCAIDIHIYAIIVISGITICKCWCTTVCIVLARFRCIEACLITTTMQRCLVIIIGRIRCIIYIACRHRTGCICLCCSTFARCFIHRTRIHINITHSAVITHTNRNAIRNSIRYNICHTIITRITIVDIIITTIGVIYQFIICTRCIITYFFARTVRISGCNRCKTFVCRRRSCDIARDTGD